MHPEVLDEKRKKIFSRLHHFGNCYLAGGTALALQIGHRTSLDFDLFLHKAIPKTLFSKVKKVFPGAAIEPLVNNRDELTVLVRGIKLTFFHYLFPAVRAFKHYQGVSLTSVKEIAADKAHTIGRRGKYRDYVDLYFILFEKHASLDELMKLADKKFGAEFNSRLFLEQLIYLQDVEEDPIFLLRGAVSKSSIRTFFEEKIKEVAF